MKLTNKEAIANLNHIYGIVSPDIQRSLDVAFKALEIRPQGEWIKDFYGNPRCNKCKCLALFDLDGQTMCKSNFCPNCGAKMKQGES